MSLRSSSSFVLILVSIVNLVFWSKSSCLAFSFPQHSSSSSLLHSRPIISTTLTRRRINQQSFPTFLSNQTNRQNTHLSLSITDLDSLTSITKLLFQSSSTNSALASAYSSPIPIIPSLLLNISLFTILSPKLKTMLTPEGFAHSLALGTLLWATLGWKGWTTCVLYLFLGQLVTKVKFQEKQKKGIAEGRGGRRGPENVWGSAATALACACASLQIHPTITASAIEATFLGLNYNSLILAYVASLATKLGDTFASEIGKAYGKTTFLITTFERVEPGTEGAVSAEGTAAAAIGGSLLPLYAYYIGLLTDWTSVGVATLAAFLATNAESWIGAVLQGKDGFKWMTNEVVNFLNTVIGAVLAIGISTSLGFII